MFEALSQRYADTLFVNGYKAGLETQTWYIARLQPNYADLRNPDEADLMPRPWKAVRVDRERYTMFQGSLHRDKHSVEIVDTYWMVGASFVEVGPKLTEEEVRTWLREFNQIREAARAEQVA
jgi:hypothetical protein